MDIFRLFLATIIQHKVWVVWILLLGVGALVFPTMTPWEQEPSLIEPARAHTVWVLFWLISLTWVLYQAAAIGTRLRRDGLGDYFASQGSSQLSQMLQGWSAVMVFVIGFTLIAGAITIFGASPAAEDQATAWSQLTLQYMLLAGISIGSLVFLALSLGTRVGATVAYLVTLGLGLHGLYGVGYLRMFSRENGSPIGDTLWTVSPHFHLADLTHRLVFKSGQLSSSTFSDILLYLLGVLLVLAGISAIAFNSRQSSK